MGLGGGVSFHCKFKLKLMCKCFQCPKSNHKYVGKSSPIKLLHIYCKTIFPVCAQHEESISAFSVF